jgi:hypothetical protein
MSLPPWNRRAPQVLRNRQAHSLGPAPNLGGLCLRNHKPENYVASLTIWNFWPARSLRHALPSFWYFLYQVASYVNGYFVPSNRTPQPKKIVDTSQVECTAEACRFSLWPFCVSAQTPKTREPAAAGQAAPELAGRPHPLLRHRVWAKHSKFQR